MPPPSGDTYSPDHRLGSPFALACGTFRSPRTLSEFNRVSPISCALLLPAPALNQGPFPPPALPGFLSTTGLSATPARPNSPSRASGWSSRPTTQWGFPCCVRFPLVYMPSPLPRHGDWVRLSLTSPAMTAFPVRGIGRPVQRPFRGLLSVHSRYGLHTR